MPVVAELFYNAGNLTVAVITKPFFFEGRHRMRLAMEGLNNLRPVVDSLLVVPKICFRQPMNPPPLLIVSS
jgi:cell division protein FtsZ